VASREGVAPRISRKVWLAYVCGADGRYTAICLAVLTLRDDGQISDLTVFILPEQFKAWGYPVTLD
jgi:hypothetical protein